MFSRNLAAFRKSLSRKVKMIQSTNRSFRGYTIRPQDTHATSTPCPHPLIQDPKLHCSHLFPLSSPLPGCSLEQSVDIDIATNYATNTAPVAAKTVKQLRRFIYFNSYDALLKCISEHDAHKAAYKKKIETFEPV